MCAPGKSDVARGRAEQYAVLCTEVTRQGGWRGLPASTMQLPAQDQLLLLCVYDPNPAMPSLNENPE